MQYTNYCSDGIQVWSLFIPIMIINSNILIDYYYIYIYIYYNVYVLCAYIYIYVYI